MFDKICDVRTLEGVKVTETDVNRETEKLQVLAFKAPLTTAADDIHKYFFIVFQRK